MPLPVNFFAAAFSLADVQADAAGWTGTPSSARTSATHSLSRVANAPPSPSARHPPFASALANALARPSSDFCVQAASTTVPVAAAVETQPSAVLAVLAEALRLAAEHAAGRSSADAAVASVVSRNRDDAAAKRKRTR